MRWYTRICHTRFLSISYSPFVWRMRWLTSLLVLCCPIVCSFFSGSSLNLDPHEKKKRVLCLLFLLWRKNQESKPSFNAVSRHLILILSIIPLLSFSIQCSFCLFFVRFLPLRVSLSRFLLFLPSSSLYLRPFLLMSLLLQLLLLLFNCRFVLRLTIEFSVFVKQTSLDLSSPIFLCFCFIVPLYFMSSPFLASNDLSFRCFSLLSILLVWKEILLILIRVCISGK